MKKYSLLFLLLFLLLLGMLVPAQKKKVKYQSPNKSVQKNFLTGSVYTFEEVENSNDMRALANFIKFNPNHPRTPELKYRLVKILNGESVGSSLSSSSKSNAGVSKARLSPKYENENTQILNHLLNGSANSSVVYLGIINNSKCEFSVKVEGNKSYQLTIASGEKGHKLIDKGKYKVSTLVCGEPYYLTDNFFQDSELKIGEDNTYRNNTSSSSKQKKVRNINNYYEYEKNNFVNRRIRDASKLFYL